MGLSTSHGGAVERKIHMTNIPNDPIILLSYVNTKLRDEYDNLDDLCADLCISREELEKKLAAVGFVYNVETNSFK